jgi:hypothetical protein
MYFYFKIIALSFCSGRKAQAAERLGRWFRVRFSTETRYLSLLHGISYIMGTRGCFSRNKLQESKAVRSAHLLSIYVHAYLYLPRPTPPSSWCGIYFTSYMGAGGSVVSWDTMLQTGRSRDRVPMRDFQPHYDPGVDSASNRNQYQESSWGGKGLPVCKTDNLTAFCEPIV